MCIHALDACLMQPHARDASPGVDQKRQEAERQRREWRDGLKAHIQQQRVTAGPSNPSQDAPFVAGAVGGAAAEALTWAELKLAAQEGFEELMRQQQVQQWVTGGAADTATRSTRNRSPYRGPPKSPTGALTAHRACACRHAIPFGAQNRSETFLDSSDNGSLKHAVGGH